MINSNIDGNLVKRIMLIARIGKHHASKLLPWKPKKLKSKTTKFGRSAWSIFIDEKYCMLVNSSHIRKPCSLNDERGTMDVLLLIWGQYPSPDATIKGWKKFKLINSTFNEVVHNVITEEKGPYTEEICLVLMERCQVC
jgi:hypothetical protein